MVLRLLTYADNDMRWEGRGHIVTVVRTALKSWDPSEDSRKHRKVLSKKAMWLDLCLKTSTWVEMGQRSGQEARAFIQVRGSGEGSGLVGRRWTTEMFRETTGKRAADTGQKNGGCRALWEWA